MRVTLQDIASAVGVSEQAVSYALRGIAKVSPEMRLRILAEAEKLGYRPHAGARAMASGSFGAITLLQAATGGYTFLAGQLLRGIVEETERSKRHLGITRLSVEQMEDREPLPQALRDSCADGILLNMSTQPPPALERVLRRIGVPCIWLNIKRTSDCVHPDDHGAALALVRRLRERGCSRIGYIDSHGLEVNAHYSRADRCAGYRAGMREAGLREAVLLGDPHAGWDGQGGAIKSWFAAQDGLQALITYTDLDLDLFDLYVQPRVAGIQLQLATFLSRQNRPLLPAWRADPPDLEIARVAVEDLGRKMATPKTRLPPRPIPFTIVEPALIGTQPQRSG